MSRLPRPWVRVRRRWTSAVGPMTRCFVRASDRHDGFKLRKRNFIGAHIVLTLSGHAVRCSRLSFASVSFACYWAGRQFSKDVASVLGPEWRAVENARN